MKISACYIVKNEAQNLPRSLASLAGQVDEIIVVDTGSTDSTVDMARAAGAVVYAYAWQDDFAAAKNYALEQATGEWSVFLDADEFFSEGVNLRAGIKKYLQAQPQLEAVFVTLYNIDVDNNNAILNSNQVVRILKNAPYLRYQGAVHEQLVDVKSPERVLHYAYAGEEMAVNHTGYSSSIIRRKLERNLHLLQDSIEQGAPIEKNYGRLADCYFGLGYYQEALDCALQATQSPYQPIGHQGDAYHLALEAMQDLEYSVDDRLAVAQAAAEIVPDVPDFWGYQGAYLLERGDWQGAKVLLSKVFALCNSHQASHFTSLALRFRTMLADTYALGGEIAQARDLYLDSLSENKWYPEALTGYLDTFAAISDVEVQLHKIYSEAQEWAKLQDLLAVHGYISMELCGANPVAIVKDIQRNIQFLFVALLADELDFAQAMTKEQLKLLPESVQGIVRAYHGRSAGQPLNFDSYLSMLHAVCTYGTAEICDRYILLAAEFSEAERAKIAEQLKGGQA